MLQMGMIRQFARSADPQVQHKRVNLTDEAYSYGGPDCSVVILMHAINMVLATTGGADRARHHPRLLILAASLGSTLHFPPYRDRRCRGSSRFRPFRLTDSE